MKKINRIALRIIDKSLFILFESNKLLILYDDGTVNPLVETLGLFEEFFMEDSELINIYNEK